MQKLTDKDRQTCRQRNTDREKERQRGRREDRDTQTGQCVDSFSTIKEKLPKRNILQRLMSSQEQIHRNVRNTDRQRQADRQTDKQREKERERERERERQTYRDRDILLTFSL